MAAVLLAGCASSQSVDGGSYAAHGVRGARSDQGSATEQDTGALVHTELIGTMLNQRQYYAALAHVQDAQNRSGRTPELRYFEAEARRELGQAATAEALYKGLLKTPYEGEAHHGLGLLQAKRGDLAGAVQHLRQAVQRRPTDFTMRNDLGYALMASGRYREALPELSTAVELETQGNKSRNNLLVLLLLMKDETRVKQVVDESGVSKQELVQLRKQAQSLRERIMRRPAAKVVGKPQPKGSGVKR